MIIKNHGGLIFTNKLEFNKHFVTWKHNGIFCLVLFLFTHIVYLDEHEYDNVLEIL